MASRFEVRLDPECRERLHELAEKDGVPASEVVRRLIDHAYESIAKARKLQAVQELAGMSMEIPGNPEDLYRILERTHEPPIIS